MVICNASWPSMSMIGALINDLTLQECRVDPPAGIDSLSVGECFCAPRPALHGKAAGRLSMSTRSATPGKRQPDT